MKSVKSILHSLFKKTGYSIQPYYTLQENVNMGKYKWLEEYKIKTLLDVGANIGEFSTLMKQILPDLKIYCFEPLKDCFLQLQLIKEKYSNIKLFKIGLGEINEEKIINHNEFAPSSSLLKATNISINAFPYTSKSIEEKIKICTLDSLQDEIIFEKNILLKIDVQGYEKQVLLGAKTVLPKIAVIIIELSIEELYEGQPLFDEIYNFLKENSFRYVGNYDQMFDPRNGKVLQVDSIFINTNLIQ